MAWDVEFHDEFDIEFRQLDEGVQDALIAVAKLLIDYARSSAGLMSTR